MLIAKTVFEKSRILKGLQFDHQILEKEVKNLVVSQSFAADERLLAFNKRYKTFVIAVHSIGRDVAQLCTYVQRHKAVTDCTIGEAVHATTAALGYFNEVTIEDPLRGTFHTFIDSGIGHNNPAECTVEEAKQI